MKKSKAEIIREKIIAMVAKLDIAGFLKDETSALLKYLHFYKLNNILANKDALKEYLLFLDEKNTEQIQKLCETIGINGDEDSEELTNPAYILSTTGREQIPLKKIAHITQTNSTKAQDLQTLLLGIKGLFLLTSNEFCHASMTRMSINKTIWEKKKTQKGKKTIKN